MKESIKGFIIHSQGSVVEALQLIDKNAKGILFVVDGKGKIEGAVTDGDIRRWLIHTGELQGKVFEFMNSKPKFVYENNIQIANEVLNKYKITALPVVDINEIIVDIIFRDFDEKKCDIQEKNLKDILTVIMAGGEGTRLYPYTKILPKPLIPIGDVPIMERIMNNFSLFGVHSFIATVNYKKNMIMSYFGEQEAQWNIEFVEEDVPLGTAGSLKLINHILDNPFFVTNCDILIRADYNDIYKYHVESENELTIIAALKNIVIPYGVIHSSENGTIYDIEEKPKLSNFVNTGMYVLNPNLLEDIPSNHLFHMTDLVEKLLKEGRRVGMYPISEDSFLDMGEFEEMHRMEEKLNLK